MLPLARKTLPASSEELRVAIEESLGQIVTATGPMATVDEKSYPSLESLRISLDGATVRDLPPRPLMPASQTEPALTVEQFEISGAPIRARGAALNLQCRARGVELGQARDRDGNVGLVLQSAAEGSVEIAVSVSDLESLVRSGANAAAAAQGVSIENVRIELRSRGPRALDVTAHVKAKKLFLSATVRLSGSVEVDERLQARISGLNSEGEGKLASLACGFLNPYLQRFEGREFSLMALPLGEIELRDVRVATGADLRLSAQFGRSSA